MKRFTFRLERLLQLRVLVEQEQARRLASARDQESVRLAFRNAAAERVSEAIAQLSATPVELSTAGTLGNLTLALDAARVAVVAANAAHQEAAVKLETEGTAFDGARRARRALERLREARQEAWTREALQSEQHTLDEVALRVSRDPQVPQ